MYHVLIFHKGGQYSLDIAGEEDTPALFSSLDDLVVFCMSHQMKMEGDKVRLPLSHCTPSYMANWPTFLDAGLQMPHSAHVHEDTCMYMCIICTTV